MKTKTQTSLAILLSTENIYCVSKCDVPEKTHHLAAVAPQVFQNTTAKPSTMLQQRSSERVYVCV